MKKSSISGWKNVYSFTLIQTLKSKTFLVSAVIMLLISIFTLPVISMITNDTKEAGKSHIETVYIQDISGLSDTPFEPQIEDEDFAHIKFEPLKGSYDDAAKRIEKSEPTSIILEIAFALDSGYTLTYTKPTKGPITKSETKALGAILEQKFNEYKNTAVGMTQEEVDFLQSDIKTNVISTDLEGEPIVKKDTKITFAEYWFIYGLLFVVLMVTTLSGTQIATSIASDKSTRVVEYLLTTVRPLALMIGKILSMITLVLGQITVMILCLFASDYVSRNYLNSGAESLIAKYVSPEILSNLNIVNILISLLVLGLGLAFYGTLAGFAGATVSKIEELNEGMTLFTIVDMIGVYIALAAVNMLMNAGVSGYTQFTLFFPLSSPFILPGALMLGKISPLMAVGSIALLLIFVALLFTFVAKIYETLILYNGSTISPKQLIGMFKSVAKEGKANEQ